MLRLVGRRRVIVRVTWWEDSKTDGWSTTGRWWSLASQTLNFSHVSQQQQLEVEVGKYIE